MRNIRCLFSSAFPSLIVPQDSYWSPESLNCFVDTNAQRSIDSSDVFTEGNLASINKRIPEAIKLSDFSNSDSAILAISELKQKTIYPSVSLPALPALPATFQNCAAEIKLPNDSA